MAVWARHMWRSAQGWGEPPAPASPLHCPGPAPLLDKQAQAPPTGHRRALVGPGPWEPTSFSDQMSVPSEGLLHIAAHPGVQLPGSALWESCSVTHLPAPRPQAHMSLCGPARLPEPGKVIPECSALAPPEPGPCSTAWRVGSPWPHSRVQAEAAPRKVPVLCPGHTSQVPAIFPVSHTPHYCPRPPCLALGQGSDLLPVPPSPRPVGVGGSAPRPCILRLLSRGPFSPGISLRPPLRDSCDTPQIPL